MKSKAIRLGAGFALISSLVCNSAFADLKELINENKNVTAVITQVPGNPTDSGYGLLVTPSEEFVQKLSLTSPDKLDNAYFTVVENEGSTPLPVGDFDGDNVLYHLMQARAYYAKLVQGSGFADPALDNKTIVRVRVTEAYNLADHFAQKVKQNNNSAYEVPNYEGKWAQEIWFNTGKGQFEQLNVYDLTVNTGLSVVSKNWINLGIELPLELYSHYNGGIDGAKIPNVIYHEAFHWATDADGYIPMAGEGNPVAEDYANYFGSSFNGKPEMADIGEFSSRFYKRNYNSIKPIKDVFPTHYNATAFGPSVFWQIRKWLGQERADQLIWNSLHYLNGTFKETDVPSAVMTAAKNFNGLSADELAKISDLLNKNQQSYLNLDIKMGSIPAGTTLEALLKKADAATLQQAASQQADLIRKIPDELRAQNIPMTSEQEAAVKQAADQLEAESAKPDFKDKVLHALKKVGHGFERAGLDIAKTIGYLGDGVYAVSNAPLTFGTDFTTGLIFGRGLVSEGNRNSHVGELVGAGGGIATFYYAYVGLNVVGSAVLGPVTSSSMGVVMVNGLVCTGQSPNSTTELARYCKENAKIMRIITMDSGKAGAKIGDNVHKFLVKWAKEQSN